ncbi:hypothetical protein CHLNCDRAFT_50078 [Chlorella variabilis]|uniref:Flavin reductase like domain-containing protein n=1 Tax=Chlorella variabilis TaxID=554065 RepID=E1Z3P1_CHLVA|nr:hypothetical protein CHLNCDRAFT_50078 [Chlorella variabilis]EFN59513.1 hypothetical protein CHLNCDRAFT_50078 [Chlorella variabilis]|eukprot:XP_005851615.1 hypothetical protein CHLNCDRAFT_50078 [Chlorella variabilis]
MNLVTYASPISLKPRQYALGLYLNTLSWENMLATRTGLLQVLGEQHAALFELLGRTSGRDVDKLAELAARGVPVTRRPADGIPLLDDSLGWMELRFASEPVNYGDHDVVICEVTDWHTPAAAGGGAAQALYTGRLRELGLIAIFFRTPLDFLFWFSCVESIAALFGLTGVFTAQPTLVTLFFG